MGSRIISAGVASVLLSFSFIPISKAVDLEVTHWWTSGGEAAAVRVLADSFNALGGDKWVDGAIAGSGSVARPLILSRIQGGDPMGATQLNHGRDAEELVEAGYMLDLTDLAIKEKWRDIVHPVSLLDACTVDGRIYCVPVNIHSWQWLWLSRKAFKTAGVDVPKDWHEFVAAAPVLSKAGIVPLAVGDQSWQAAGMFNVILPSLGGLDLWRNLYVDKNAKIAGGSEMTKIFHATDVIRKMTPKSNVQDWNQATALVINGKAGGQIMGDWAQGEFSVANKKAGVDYECLPGLGVHDFISTGGDAFYFPKQKDAAVQKAQLKLASMLLRKDVQVNFNLAKGSLPVRGDVSLSAANDCMKKGLKVLAAGRLIPDSTIALSADTRSQIDDLIVEFVNDNSISVAEVQKRFVSIIESAD